MVVTVLETERDSTRHRNDWKPRKYHKNVENLDFARNLQRVGDVGKLVATIQVDGSDRTAKTSATEEDLGSTVNYWVGGFEILKETTEEIFTRRF